ncbi:C4-dicarboxylate-binding periplasmic protein precursor [Variovorax sp. SRS16]|uniref:TRAP transporter substrate-binding protein n=1 Tax=Variovorax sp. SRS16 TaxID=282217 RepID=UPI001318FCB0|nr:ABC transporter substrate-binding protein [Variovorax sp. SRS16]VTU26611.1 C4-dicarboxylate-binding periplasmic protein precursor [Variovorax sp. SRS16]
MQRRSLIQRGALAGLVAAGIAPAVHAQAATRWRLASGFARPLDLLYGGAETFARKVGEMTGGRFQIEVHAAGELMPARAVLDGVQQGAIEACHTAGASFAAKDEVFAIGSALPFGMNARQLSAWMTEGNGLKLTREFYGRLDALNFSCGNTGAPAGAWFRREIRSPHDFKGLKFCFGGLAPRVLERLGGVPQKLADSEVVAALAKGTIGAAEGLSPYDDQKLGLQKAASHYAYPGWWSAGLQLELLVNRKAFDALSAEYKAIVEAACAFTQLDMQARYAARNPVALQQLIRGGTVAQAFPKPVLEAAFKATLDLDRELSARNAGWKKIHGDYLAFQKEALSGARYAEAPFDAFLQSMKW